MSDLSNHVLEIDEPPGPARVVRYRARDDGRGAVQSATIDGIAMTLKERGDGWSDWYTSFPTGRVAIIVLSHKRK